ncbi:hypothetical protein HDV01_004861 [Terramyces sp. JEL0728]|nr:hypothetical protein HDV01_004861 [Terramyces sp. JEL0728]
MAIFSVEDLLASIISLVSIICSIYIIANKSAYFMGGTQFGNLVLSVAISDLLSGLLWPLTLPFQVLISSYNDGSIQMPLDEIRTLKITLIVLQAAGYFLLFFSLYMALAISMISFYVVVCNGSSKMLDICKIIIASSIIPLIDSVLLFLYVPLSQLDADHQDRDSYALPQTMISILPLLGMTFCFIYTMVKLNKMVEHDYESKKIFTIDEKDGTLKIIMLKTILALTVSNMAFWYLQIALFILNNHNDTFTSRLAEFLQNISGPAKGAIHLLALAFSFDCTCKEEDDFDKTKPKFWGFSQQVPVTIQSKSFSESVNSVETNK